MTESLGWLLVGIAIGIYLCWVFRADRDRRFQLERAARCREGRAHITRRERTIRRQHRA